MKPKLKTKRKTVSLRLDPILIAKLRAQDIDVNWFIEECIKKLDKLAPK